MDDNTTDNKSDSIEVTLGSTEYTITAGTSVGIEVFLANPSSSGDYFKVNLLGLPPSWIAYSGPPSVWVPAGGQEKVIFNVGPPAMAEGITGSYLGRLHVFSQSAPEKGKELEVLLKVLPDEKTKGTVLLRVQSNELKATPGTELKIPLTISNLSQGAEFLELSVQGVPTSWVSFPSPVITLSGGEEKRVDVILQIPSTPEIRAGYFPLKIYAASQKDPMKKGEVEVKLAIGAFESNGRIGVVLRSVQFSVAPGGSLTIPITVLNRGMEGDAFHLMIEGIPLNWVSTSTPVIPLGPGEIKEVSLMIRPSLSPSSQAGRNKFRITVASQGAPDQVVKVDCTLTVAAYTQFSAELEPKEVNAGQPVTVSVKNEGNIQQVFHIAFVSQNDQLLFEFLQPAEQGGMESSAPLNENAATGSQPGAPVNTQPHAPRAASGEQTGDPTLLPIPPGESAAFKFNARPRQRRLIGGVVFYPYNVSVKSQQKEAPSLPGQVIGRGVIPMWILPLTLFLCVLIFLGAIILGRQSGAQAGSATQTSVAGTALVIGATQTITANQTAAAVAGQQDSDGDGLTNQPELELGTDPNNPDTDGDGLLDGVEVFQTGTNPLIADTDGDGINDGQELQLKTNPLNPDTDGDGLMDGDEIRLGTDPLKPDTDNDGLTDGQETPPCPDPLNPDSDHDGIIDGKDLDPCNANNPALTATAASLLPTPTLVPPTAVPSQTPVDITPSPTAGSLPRFGGMILFVSNRDGNPEIYALDDAGHIKRMTDNPAADIQPVWAPDMQRFAFTTNRDGQNEIYLMNADGTNLLNLTTNPADDQYPTWSVDGQWIAFSSNRDGNDEIYLLNVSTYEVHNLTNSPGNDTQPNWVRSTTMDPSGEFILFTSDRDGNQEIYRMKTDGTEAVNLTGNPANDQMAKGSPDSTLVVFTTDRDGNQEIYSMRIDGNGPANLTNNPSNDFGSCWSPEQAWIAFTSARNGNNEVYITKPGVSELYNLTNNPSSDQVADWR